MTAGRRRRAPRAVTEPPLVPTGAELPVILPAKLCFLIKSIVKERLACIPLSCRPLLSISLPLPPSLPPAHSLSFSLCPSRASRYERARSYVRECLRRVTVAPGQNRELSKFIRLSHSPRGISYFVSFLLLLLLLPSRRPLFFSPRTFDKFQIACGS